MYPFARMGLQFLRHRNDPALAVTGTHVSQHLCLPWDLDPWNELNNGRTLTLYDLGRIPLSYRTGLIGILRKNHWGLTVAGSAVRYRRRVKAFDKLTMKSRCATWDARFFYLEQSMWKTNGDCASHAVFRSAVVGKAGIVDPAEVISQSTHTGPPPPMPDFIAKWIGAEDVRVWPPMAEP
jgi:acyl-CoA thioesterase FadM